MANHIRYVRRRGHGMFYYERRIPKAIMEQPAKWQAHFGGKKLHRVSLRTKSQSQAFVAAHQEHIRFENQLKAAISSISADSLNEGEPRRPVTPAILDRIRHEMRERTVRPWSRAVIRAEHGEEFAAELQRMAEQREDQAEDLRDILLGRRVSPDPSLPNVAEEVERFVVLEQLEAPKGSDERALISASVREGLTAGQREIDDILSGKRPAADAARLSGNRPRAPKLSEVMEAYIGRQNARRTIHAAQDAAASIIRVIGDLPLDEVTRAMVIDFCKIEGGRSVGGKSKGSVARPISPETLKKKVSLIRAAINHSIATDVYSGENPASRIEAHRFTKPVPKAIMPDKRPFTVHELQQILGHPWFTGCESATQIHQPGKHHLTGMHYWVPILAMHTGCRAGELGGLRISDVRIDHQHPHIVIQPNMYRKTKGSYRRNVPVIDILFSLGFAEFVERVGRGGHDRLFHDWEPPAGKASQELDEAAWSNAGLIRAFNRTLVRQQLDQSLTDGVLQEVTFHSFRGAFKTLLGRAEYGLPENYKHEVVGHSKSALDQRYVQEIPLADTYPAIRKCRYDGLKIPTLELA